MENKNYSESSELTQLKANLTKASPNYTIDDCMSMISSLGNYVSYLEKRIYEQDNATWKYIGEHNNGHLPKLTPGGLEKLIKAAGEDSNYEVQKRIIWANHNKVSVANVTYIPNDK